MATRVLVTGASGFVGRQIIAALGAMKVKAIGVGRRPPAAEVEWHATDLRDGEARRRLLAAVRAEILVHAAWIGRPREIWTNPENVDWVGWSVALLREFAAAGGRRFAFVGSAAEYDWSYSGKPRWDESRPCRPCTPYGAAKLAAWTAILSAARRHGVSAVNARLFLPVGRFEPPDRLLPQLVRATLGGRAIETGPGDHVRDFIDVRDAGAAVARLAMAKVEGPVNVGTGRPVTVSELARQIAAHANAEARLRIGTLPARIGDAEGMVADTSRLAKETGFAAHIPLAVTIADSFAYWQGRSPAPLRQPLRTPARAPSA